MLVFWRVHAELQFSFCRVFNTVTCPTKKKKKPLAATLIRSKLFSVFSLANCQGFMSLGHRDPTAPGVCVALDLPYNISCHVFLYLEKTLSESGQYIADIMNIYT